jgi:pyruvate kinase
MIDDEKIDQAVGNAAMHLANHVKAQAIISLTESGSTALRMSRINTHLPIYALSRNTSLLGRMTLYRGVIPVEFNPSRNTNLGIDKYATSRLEKLGFIEKEDWIIVTSGDSMVHGGTNTIKVVQSI